MAHVGGSPARAELVAHLARLKSDATAYQGRPLQRTQVVDMVNRRLRQIDEMESGAHGKARRRQPPSEVTATMVGFWEREGKVATEFSQLSALIFVLHERAGKGRPNQTELNEIHVLWDRARKEPPLSKVPPTPNSSEASESSSDDADRGPEIRRRSSRRWVVAAFASVVILTAGSSIYLVSQPQGGTATGPSHLSRGSDPDSPIQVQGVTIPPISPRGGDFIVEEPLTLSSEELRAFNDQTTTNGSGSHLQSQIEFGGVPQDFTTVVMTLATNLVEPVTVMDIRPIRECVEPFHGTYFQIYRQGSGATPNVELGVDLDNPDAHAQQLDDRGSLTDVVYFAHNSIVLAPGEPTTVSVAALTTRYGCEFKLEVMVATPGGTATQVVDNSGEPFKVTAKAAPEDGLFPLSGYSSAYVQGAGNVWRYVDPSSYRGTK